MAKATIPSPNGDARPRSQTITEAAYNLMKRGILQGRFPEGSFLSEVQVMKEFGIGRTPFREACNRLHHEELLEVVPRRGYLVSKMNFYQVRDFFELRLLVEGMVAELAALRAGDEEIAQLATLADPPLTGTREQQLEQAIDANKAFHTCLASMTGNRELVKVLTRILERNERISYLESRASYGPTPELMKLHHPVVAAIRNHDPERARAAVVADIMEAQLSAFGRDFWSRARENSPSAADLMAVMAK